jgi:FtsZ-interacting cell division protein ZipA
MKKTCAEETCNKKFESNRNDALFCSDACKQRHYRKGIAELLKIARKNTEIPTPFRSLDEEKLLVFTKSAKKSKKKSAKTKIVAQKAAKEAHDSPKNGKPIHDKPKQQKAVEKPKNNVSVLDKPVREPGEDAFSFAERKNAWKKANA